jgi:hypothetical protein
VTRPTRSDTEAMLVTVWPDLKPDTPRSTQHETPPKCPTRRAFQNTNLSAERAPYGTSRTQPQDASATVPEDAHRSRRCSCFPVELSTFGRRPKGARKRTSNCIASMSLKCHLRTWRESVREGPDLSENTHFNLRKSELILRQWCVRGGQPSSWRHG